MELTLVREGGDVLCRHCEIADSPFTRAKGLLGRSELGQDEGMLVATSAIHTYFMRFPLDLVFLDKNFVVVRTVSSLKPWRFAVDRRARSVVELAAGVVESAAVREGEQFSLVRHGERAAEPLTAQSGNGNGNVRVAVASSDTRFLRVSRFLLARHAFDVETYGDPDALLSDSRRRADVVLLDSSTSLAVAARVIRDLSVLSPTTAFVVVGEQLDPATPDSAQSLRILPKWESFDRLVDEIRSASIAEAEHEFA